LITYENLIKNTKLSLRCILSFLGIPIDDQSLESAIVCSSKDELKKEESRLNVTNLIADVNASFIRKGGVDEWHNDEILKNNFEVQSLIDILHLHKINLTEFQIN